MTTTTPRRPDLATGDVLPVVVVTLAAAAWLVLLWPAGGHSHASTAAGPCRSSQLAMKRLAKSR